MEHPDTHLAYLQQMDTDRALDEIAWQNDCALVIYAYFLDEIDDVTACKALGIPYAHFEALALAEIERLS